MKLNNTTALILLAISFNSNRTAYDMRKDTINQNGLDISHQIIYREINALAKEGYVSRVEGTSGTNGMSTYKYSLTLKGEDFVHKNKRAIHEALNFTSALALGNTRVVDIDLLIDIYRKRCIAANIKYNSYENTIALEIFKMETAQLHYDSLKRVKELKLVA